MNIDTSTLLAGALKAIAAASLIGGGTMVLEAHRSNAVQDKQIEQLDHRQQDLDGSIKRLNDSAQALDRSVAVLNERLKD